MNKKRNTSGRQDGFTLVEMIVAVGLFAIVMTICVDVLLSLVNANRKAQALQLVMNNLNVSLDSMVRNMREGTIYHCGTAGAFNTPSDCANGDTTLAYEPYGNDSTGKPWIYSYAVDSNGVGRIYRSTTGSTADAIPITSPEVSIDEMHFYVTGTTPGSSGDTTQPRVVIVIKGTAGAAGSSAQTTFHIQATAVQRQLDI